MTKEEMCKYLEDAGWRWRMYGYIDPLTLVFYYRSIESLEQAVSVAKERE